MQSEKRLCPICNEIIVGREDKKFCSTRCKNKFSNREVKKIYYAGKAALKGEPQTLKTVQIQEPKTIKILRPETKKIEVNKMPEVKVEKAEILIETDKSIEAHEADLKSRIAAAREKIKLALEVIEAPKTLEVASLAEASTNAENRLPQIVIIDGFDGTKMKKVKTRYNSVTSLISYAKKMLHKFTQEDMKSIYDGISGLLIFIEGKRSLYFINSKKEICRYSE